MFAIYVYLNQYRKTGKSQSHPDSSAPQQDFREHSGFVNTGVKGIAQAFWTDRDTAKTIDL